jgi:hypothetical protein
MSASATGLQARVERLRAAEERKRHSVNFGVICERVIQHRPAVPGVAKVA